MTRRVILGGGESGYGAAVLGRKLGMDVFLSDAGSLKAPYKELLTAREIPFEEGAHSDNKIMQADLVVKSPGIPDSAPLVKALREKGIPVISRPALASCST